MSDILVIAPHPDDESLGCGGTLLKHLDCGDRVHWLIITGMDSPRFSEDEINIRSKEIKKVNEMYGFSSITEFNYPPAKLDQVETSKIIEDLNHCIKQIKPNTIYTVFRNDAHSDHQVVFDATMSVTKSFRNSYTKRVLVYETPSETNFSNPLASIFKPNLYINIEDFLEKKLQILNIYNSEMGNFPFPRSSEAIKALASIRGVEAGCMAAEAFMLIKEVR